MAKTETVSTRILTPDELARLATVQPVEQPADPHVAIAANEKALVLLLKRHADASALETRAKGREARAVELSQLRDKTVAALAKIDEELGTLSSQSMADRRGVNPKDRRPPAEVQDEISRLEATIASQKAALASSSSSTSTTPAAASSSSPPAAPHGWPHGMPWPPASSSSSSSSTTPAAAPSSSVPATPPAKVQTP